MKQAKKEKEFYDQLEGLRGVAILLVLISHFILVPNFPKLLFLKLGFWGVNVFFVLSGFLISEMLMRDLSKEKSAAQILKSFYLRRILRIFPVYYLTLLSLYIFNIGNTRDVLPYTLTYTYNLANVWKGVHSEPLTHLWSLCVEEQFYLFWPLLLVLLNRKYHLHLILVMILMGVASRLIYIGLEMPNYQNFIWSTPSCFDCLGLGALLAWLKLNNIAFLKKVLGLYCTPALLAIVFWVLARFTGAADDSFLFAGFGRFIVGLVGFSLVGVGALGKSTGYGMILNLSWLRFIGRISYGLYVYHWIVFVLLENKLRIWIRGALNFNSNNYILDKLQYNTYIIVSFILTTTSILVAFVSYKVIEKPLLQLKEKL